MSSINCVLFDAIFSLIDTSTDSVILEVNTSRADGWVEPVDILIVFERCTRYDRRKTVLSVTKS